MRVLMLSVTDASNGVRYFDTGLARGLGRAQSEVLVRPQASPGEVEWLKPDLVMMRVHKSLFSTTDLRTVERLRAKGAKVCAWLSPWIPKKYQLTEEQKDLHTDEMLSWVRNNVDVCLTWWRLKEAKAFFDPWTDKFGIPVVEVVPAADSTLYGKVPGVEPTVDLCFIGGANWTKNIDEWLEPLLRRHTYILAGKGWKDRRFMTTDIPPEKERRYYAAAKVAPNVHMDVAFRIPGIAVNQRLFQVPCSFAFEVVDPHPGIYDYLEPDEIVVGKTAEDFAEKVEFYLTRPKARAKMVEKAHRHVAQKHTFVERGKTLIQDLRKLGMVK